ncbi:21278_t:CDS:1 [Dentiscutata erythropus]|uniref:21278_t:CDS:1 n=1 Tax=Dentiscutata erythropus TaxID=1348616 RepID=A0A9N9JM93_9GLOM|nr:21278_t:CDS:1 [Dentiscutata erythropus]
MGNNIILSQYDEIQNYINSLHIDFESSKEKILAKYDKKYLNKRSRVPNPFMLYRSEISNILKEKYIVKQELVSRFIANRWENESEMVRKWFENITDYLNQLKNPNHVNKKEKMSSKPEEIITISLNEAINSAYQLCAYDHENKYFYFVNRYD